MATDPDESPKQRTQTVQQTRNVRRMPGTFGLPGARRMRLIVVAVAALALAAGCGSGGSSSAGNGGGSSATQPSSSASTPSGTPIKIGNVGTYSGFAGTTSIGSKYGMQAWASYVNAHGGINGHPVDLIVKDDQGSATNALAAVKELVSQDHVIAIVGQHESGLESSWASHLPAP